jgi:hypothetical protein
VNPYFSPLNRGIHLHNIKRYSVLPHIKLRVSQLQR